MRRVAVTGIGLLTALGAGRGPVWDALLAGQTGIRPIAGYEPSSFSTRLAAQLPDFEPSDYAPRRALRLTTRGDQLAIAGAALAVADAGVDLAGCDMTRAALFVGGSKDVSTLDPFLAGTRAAGMTDGRADYRRLGAHAQSAFAPLFYIEGLQSAVLFHLSQAHGFRGANAYFHGTADSGATAVGRAFRSIRRGESDLALAGGFDEAASWWSLSKLDGLGVLSPDHRRGAAAFRPYDRDRSGSILGDGAAFLMLEELDRARSRGARVYAEITGFGSAFDGDGLLTPEPSGKALAHAMSSALTEAQVDPDRVDYIATHGCATVLGDLSEARALRTVFAGRRPVASSVKPAAGHLVAAAGALNTAVCALAVAHGAVPPTLHLDDPDPACGFAFLAGSAVALEARHTLALARGLQGQQVALSISVPAA